MRENLEGKRAAVLSDSELLCTAIKANLNSGLQLEVAGAQSGGEGQPPGGSLDLIIVALSATSGEPVVALARAGLAGCIGQVPVLIISERSFEAQPEERIAHVPFPFHPDELRAAVVGLLG
jgi:hypothetical protein